ncbi:hypothetical protein [Telluribacter humicola]|uniref:hypothetical protein n=1 Tax=Telluribacter humicola TaxID=1720261 RepID=UPI001A9680B6|nr:hypothetical protein [Telluribacter humicola]
METLLIHLSNVVNGLALLVIMLFSLFRLTDGKRENQVEKVSLLLICIGSFFQLTQIHHPDGTGMDLLMLRVGLAAFLLSTVYSYVSRWI